MESIQNKHPWRIPEWFQGLSEDAVQRLHAFQTELISFNGRINLISPRSEMNADRVHVADGILGSQIIRKALSGYKIYDFGSGNGVPGFIFATLFPEVEVEAIDGDARKVEFLRHCAHRFKVPNLKAYHRRIEDLEPGSVPAAMCRGLAAVSKVLLLSRHCMEPGAAVYHFKGDQWSLELASVPAQVLPFWKNEVLGHYTLPKSSTDLTILVSIKK